MMQTARLQLPEDIQRKLQQARKLEWLSIVYLITVTVAVYFTMGSSQAMKTIWIEDILGIIPPALFVIVHRLHLRRPDQEFPYGYFRAVTIGFLVAAAALLSMGLFLFIESSSKLIAAEHPDVGAKIILGHTVWSGWIMIPAILYSGVPTVILGIKKRKLARELHDKVLFTDAEMNKADWLSAGAALVGILGIGIGWWWADAAAAMIISLDILHDGWSSMKEVIKDLMDSAPTTVDHKEHDPLPKRVEETLRGLGWVREVRVRMREYGNVMFGEAFIVAADDETLPAKLERARQQALALDWRIHDLVITLVPSLATIDVRSPKQI